MRAAAAALLRAAAAVAAWAAAAAAEPAAPAPSGADPVVACLSCHLDDAGRLDIVGVRALAALPPEWPFLFEDQFDLDGDGVAGRLRFVSGADGPAPAKYGRALAAARFADFAKLAAAAHGVDVSAPGAIARVRAAFERLSPPPVDPFADAAARARFAARGCDGCHVTRAYAFEGRDVAPLSDFLLHDLGDGPRRTAPLWGCRACVEADPHAAVASQPGR